MINISYICIKYANNMIGIYKITSPSGRIYIGQSVDIERRFKRYNILRCKGQIRLFNSLFKYGVESHTFEIIEECDIELLNERERYYQDLYDVLSDKGLNCRLTQVNDKSGKVCDETRLKMSLNNSGHMKGRKLSDKTRYKIKINSVRSKKVICTETGKIWNSAKDCYNELNFNIKYRTFINYLSGKIKNKTTIQWYN